MHFTLYASSLLIMDLFACSPSYLPLLEVMGRHWKLVVANVSTPHQPEAGVDDNVMKDVSHNTLV